MIVPAPARVGLSPGEWGLLVRFWGGAALVRVLKYVTPLRVLVALARTGVRVRPSTERVAQLTEAGASVRLGPWRVPGNCLERSLVLYRLLIASGARPHLVIGMKPGHTHAGSACAPGHVWITLGGQVVGAREDDEPGFVPVVAFDAAGQRYQPCED